MDDQHENIDTSKTPAPRSGATDGAIPEDASQEPLSDDVMSVIADVEAQLNSLKRVHEQRQTATHDLLQREKLLSDREAELYVQFEQLSAEKSVLREQREAIAAEQARVSEIDAQLREKLAQFESRSKELADTGSGLADRSRELDAARSELEARETALKEKADAIELQSIELDERLETMQAELDEHRAERDRLAGELESVSNERERERNGLQATIDELKKELDRASAEHDSQTEAQSAARAAAEEATEEARIAGERIAELEEELLTSGDERERLANALEKAANGRRELLKNIEALEAAAGESSSRIATLEAEMASLRSALEQAEASSAELVAARDAAVSRAERAEQEAKANAGKATALETRLAQVTDKLKMASAALGEQAKAAVGSVDASAALDSARETAQTLRAQLVEAEAARRIAEERAERLARDAKNRPAAAPSAGGGLAPAAGGEPSPAVQPGRAGSWRATEDERRRRERLLRAKRLIRAQAAKIRRASDALGARYAQCEQLLTQRAELVRMKTALDHDRQRIDKAKGRQSFAITFLAVAGALALMGGLSFAAVKQFWPGQYAATTMLAAEPGERRLGPEDLASWTIAHEEMVLDPHFLEVAAERMQRRGIAEFASAPVLGEYLRQNLSVLSPEPGKVQLELRGNGKDRVARVLQTYAVTLATSANQGRARRIDGAGTLITQDATPTGTPIDDAEMLNTAMVFGGSSLSVLLVGGVLWRRMVAAKQKFEQSEAVARLMDDARWVDPRGEAGRPDTFG